MQGPLNTSFATCALSIHIFHSVRLIHVSETKKLTVNHFSAVFLYTANIPNNFGSEFSDYNIVEGTATV